MTKSISITCKTGELRRWQDFTGQQAVLESTGEKFDDITARHSDSDK